MAPVGPRPEAALRQAFDWLVRLQSGAPDARTRQAFDHWLQAHPDHAGAWQRAQTVGQALRRDLGSLGSVGSLGARDALDTASRRLARRRTLAKLSVGGAVVLPGAWLAGSLTPWQRALADVATATGEQRRVALDDGTRLTLNTDSAVQLRFDARQRRVVLTRGEIALSTGPDSGQARPRPLRVQTPHGLLQALGTRFVLRLQDHASLVAVEEGEVAWWPGRTRPQAAGQALVLAQAERARAGQVMRLTADAATPADTGGLDLTGWLDGALVSRGMRLGDFLAEVSRYRPGRIGCDAQVAGLRLSGVYRLDDTDRLLALLPDLLPVRLDFLTRYWVRVSAR